MMKNIYRALGVAAIAGIVAIPLSACGEVTVESADGVGACNGHPVSLTTTQDVTGENFTIEYTGPADSDASLFLAQGFYAQLDSEPTPLALGTGDSDNVYAIKLDPTGGTGWSQSGSGNSTNYSFSGTWDDLIDGEQTAVDLYATSGEEVLNKIVPLFIGVDCDTTDSTGEFVGDGTNPVADFSLAVAQPLFPNSMTIDAFDVLSNTATANGADLTVKYSAAALADFGSFSPSTPFYFSMFADDPNVPNSNLSELWIQAFDAASWSLSPSDNGNGTFDVSITGDSGATLTDGDYLGLMLVPDTAYVFPDGPGQLKIVFVSMRYNSATGLSIVSPFAAAPALPDTGKSDTHVWATGGTALGLLVIGAGAIIVTGRMRARN